MSKLEKHLLVDLSNMISKMQTEIAELRKELKQQNKSFHYRFHNPYGDNKIDIYINYQLTPNIDYINYDDEYFLINEIDYQVRDDVYDLSLDSGSFFRHNDNKEAIVIYVDDDEDDDEDEEDDEFSNSFLLPPG